MKILATVRLSLIAFLLYRITITILDKSDRWTMIDTVVNVIMNVLVLLYIFYLIREALSEWNHRTSPNSKAFKIYGLVVEIILFLGTVWVLADFAWDNMKILSGLLSIAVVLTILVLVIIDSVKLKRYSKL